MIKQGLWFLLFLFSLSVNATTISVALSSSPSNLSPFFNVDANSQNLNRLIHTSLIDVDENMEPVCRLCESFEERFDNGKQILKFTLKKGIKFWDAKEIKAVDIKKAHELFTDTKEIKSIFRFAFGRIKEVRVLSEYVVELVYEEFKLDNIANLVLFKILKLSKDWKEGRPEVTEIIGAGDYRPSHISELSIKLKALKTNQSDLEFKVVKDETTLALKLINNEIDVSFADVSARKFDWLKKRADHLNFYSRPSSNYKYLSPNHENEHLKELNVRKALSHLIEREKIKLFKFKNNITLAKSLFSKDFPAIYKDFSIDEYSPEKAKKLLEEIGYKRDEKGWHKNNRYIELNWISNNNKSTIELVKTMIKSFENFGFKINLTVQEWGTFMKGIKKSNFDLVFAQWVGFTGPEMLEYVFHTKSFPPKGGNRGKYSNSKFDELVDKASIETKKDKRNFYYKKALAIANDDYSYINLWHPNHMLITRKCIDGLKIYPNGSFIGLNKLVSRCGN